MSKSSEEMAQMPCPLCNSISKAFIVKRSVKEIFWGECTFCNTRVFGLRGEGVLCAMLRAYNSNNLKLTGLSLEEWLVLKETINPVRFMF